MSRNTQIVAVVVIIAVVIGVYYVGVYQPQQRTAEEEEQRRLEDEARIQEWEDTLIIGIQSVTRNPNPFIGYSDWNIYLTMGHLAEATIEAANQWNGLLAESWELKHKPDGTPYTEFKIREGLTYQDGTPVTAPSIKWSFETLVESEPMYIMAWGDSSFVDIEAPDDYTLNLIHANDFGQIATLGWAGSQSYIYAASPTTAEQYWDTDPLEIVGSGPYKTVEWVHNEKVVLERWEDYPWQTYGLSGPYQFEKVIYRLYPDSVTLRSALEASEIDIAIRGITKLDLQEMESEDVNVDFYESQVRLMLMDQHYEYFNNTKVRQAVACVIDQEELVNAVVPMCEENYGFFPHVYDYYQNDEAWLSKYPEVNVAKGKQLMTEAGYSDGFDTELWICNQYQTKENEMDLAVVVKEQLAKIGINVEINYVENAVFVQKRRQTGEMPMALIGWGEDYPDVDSYMNYIMGTEGSWALSAGVHDEYVQSLLENGRRLFKGEFNDPDRKAVYDEVHEINAENAYWVPLYVETRGHAWRSWLNGYQIGPTYMFDFHLTPEMYKEAPSSGIP